MSQAETLNVAIVGGGPGCKAIMDMIFAERLQELRMNLVGVACTNVNAVGYVYALEKGVFTARDYRDLYRIKDLNMIIEMTGRDEVAEGILRTKPSHVRVMDHVAARLFWDVFRIEEERFEDRLRIEDTLRRARDDLERRVKERTSELTEANERLREEIKERRRAEDAIQKKNKELQDFVHIVSHDLRTPIISIQGFCSRLTKTQGENLDDKGMLYLKQIENSARRMENFVSDLLSLAKSGHVVSALQEVPSAAIVRDVVSFLRPRLKEAGIKITVRKNLPVVCCDRARIGQVFENLMVNAVKFVSSVENPYIEIGCKNRADTYEFYIRDNGIGIDREHHERIFDLFQRVQDGVEQEGTGVGLTIVKRIIAGHGGRTWVESEKGRGATFYFTLPKVSCGS